MIPGLAGDGLQGTAMSRHDQSLTPGDNPCIGPTRFEDWLGRSILQG